MSLAGPRGVEKDRPQRCGEKKKRAALNPNLPLLTAPPPPRPPARPPFTTRTPSLPPPPPLSPPLSS